MSCELVVCSFDHRSLRRSSSADFFEGDKVPLEELAKGNMPAFMDWYSKHEPEVVIPIFDKVIHLLGSIQLPTRSLVNLRRMNLGGR